MPPILAMSWFKVHKTLDRWAVTSDSAVVEESSTGAREGKKLYRVDIVGVAACFWRTEVKWLQGRRRGSRRMVDSHFS